MCPAVKKQFLNLYSAFGFKPTADIIVPGYKPVPPEGGTPFPGDISEKVRETEITVHGEGGDVTVTVQEMAAIILAAMGDIEAAKRKYLTGYVEDEDSDERPDNETLYLKTEVVPVTAV